jgi:4-amino-4-deoxy-L-arabinose transferase-like glycosyltransferase
MQARQKLTALILFILGLAYFVAFILPNQNGADDEHMLAMNSQDESFQYPFLMHMTTPGKDEQETRWRLISYGHYIYGYPFYVASALAVLPLRMAYGDGFPAQTQTTLLVLRQTISVLPMILSIALLTYLVTRFRQVALAIGMFAFLLTIPGVVRQNIWWWHPDALAILCVALTFFFLDQDRLRYGRNFLLAALFCGLAASIKTVGVFFAPAVAGYLLAGLIQKRIKVKKAIIAGLMFLAVMTVAFLFSNPLFFWPEQRARIIQVRIDHNYYFTHGWEDSDPYATGLSAWRPILTGWYAGLPFLVFSLLSIALVAIRALEKRLALLFLGWIFPLSLYLIYYIAVKPDHYWLPVMLPLFSGGFMLISYLWERMKTNAGYKRWWFYGHGLLVAAVTVLLIYQFAGQVQVGIELFMRAVNPI